MTRDPGKRLAMRAEEAEVASKEDAAAVEFMVVVADEGMIS